MSGPIAAISGTVLDMLTDPDARTALIIEDDADVRQLLVMTLGMSGFTTMEAENGRQGVALARERQPDLVTLDLNLPDMSGIDILARIKQDERVKRAPVVVLTTTDDQREIQRCYDLGCNVYITKPVEYETFAQAIRQLGLFLSVMQVPEG